MIPLYAVDIGNSGIRVARVESLTQSIPDPLRINWTSELSPNAPRDAPTDVVPPTEGTAPALTQRYCPDDILWLEQLQNAIDWDSKARWIISSVRQDALDRLISFLSDKKNHSAEIVTHTQIPMRLNVRTPSAVGIDRVLAAWAAAKSTDHRPLVVIQAGSAVTVDLVAGTVDHPTFEGGAIVPGIPMMLRLLGRAAEKLPVLEADEFTEMPSLPGKDTEHAMRCGASAALAGGVRLLIDDYRQKFGKQLPVILSGGDGPRIAPYIEEPIKTHSQLVLQGITALAAMGTQ